MPCLPLTLSLTAALLASAPAAAADEPPVALAGLSFLAYPGEHIILDGSQSYDPEGWDITYAWSQVAGPSVQLQDADRPNPSFDTVDPGVHTFQLIVDDGFQASDPDTVDVIVLDPGIGAADGGGCSAVGAVTGLAATILLLPVIATRRRRG